MSARPRLVQEGTPVNRGDEYSGGDYVGGYNNDYSGRGYDNDYGGRGYSGYGGGYGG
eukprot:CAMPEP_0116823732 /NCGR_PEP_ID=MMETSP0418-20121206/1003_1 /TAXON_ID=1158023 /ORGANISM="Astrosyne radiata, Strain 13vi08-1A" /LENGTH=56 /DNA_ID=CAMNT_0004452021 /DNA_START=147 /DNA_END=313 /DNA_ORIENTATION=+